MPTLAEKFASVDSNSDGKVSTDELNAYSEVDGGRPGHEPTDRQIDSADRVMTSSARTKQG